ncbi:hypothetical protein NL329_31085, partial [Klebsiella pneumoniae]|nr:hypothetical protein [Klebsiella pneumoniae]
GNTSPVAGYNIRSLTFNLYDVNNNSLAAPVNQNVAFNPTDKKFHGVVTLPNSVATGAYNLYALGAPYVNARIPGSI